MEDPATLQSASGLLSLLQEEDATVRHFAVTQLLAVVDLFWAEISDEITTIETLSEDETSGDRFLAALLASKVFYHLGYPGESTTFALKAGKLFDTNAQTEYTQTIIGQIIDQYIRTRQADEPMDERLEKIAEMMFQRCLQDGEWKQAIGIAMESRRLDVVETAIRQATDANLKSYVLDISMNVVQNLDFRNKALSLLVDLHLAEAKPDYFAVTKCVLHLNAPETAAKLLTSLVEKGDSDSHLLAFQVAFDLDSSATQDFRRIVQEKIVIESPIVDRIKNVLAGNETIDLTLEFLNRNDHTDILTLDKTKDSLDARNSIFHSAVTFANSFMHAGTTSDGFFRNNLEWLSKATNWSKFSATAALGVIHKGNLSQGMQLLAPYLPQDSVASGSPYSQGGSLFALGLIYTNHGANVLDFLRDQLKNKTDETVQHGAALGIGVAGMATADDDIYEELKNVLFSDSAIAGEATGLAMGLVMLGTASEKAIDEMLQYAHETQHEKIIRGLSMGLSLLMYAKEDAADSLVKQLLSEQDPILRYGGIFTLAMAYCGTGNNGAIREVLHVAVSDSSDDVRRAAVMSLGFIMFRNHQAVPRMVELLAESYNPHVRYGSALALGISCAGTGQLEAIEMLEPLLKDPADFVRQGALISLAMILIQQNEHTNSKVTSVRATFAKFVAENHEDAMAKFGAVLAQGIIDAGGRNVTIGLQSGAGSLDLQSIVGTLIFTQFWYWFPLTHFLSLSFRPTGIIGLNQDLKIPDTRFWSNTMPSAFEYPPKTEVSMDRAPEKVATAVLSTTARAKARAKKAKSEKADAMDVDLRDEEAKGEKQEGREVDGKVDAKKGEDKMDVDDLGEKVENEKSDEKEDKEKEEKEKEDRKEAEKPGFEIHNFSRVMPQHVSYIAFTESSRYRSVKALTGGVLMLRDERPDEEESFIEIRSRQPAALQGDGQTMDDEAPVPEEFIYETETEL